MPFFAGDLRTGLIRVRNIPVSKGDATVTVGSAGTINASLGLPMTDPNTDVTVPFTQLILPVKSFLGYEEILTDESGNTIGRKIINAGPIWTDIYDWDNFSIDLKAAGLRSIFDYRLVLPLLIDANIASLPEFDSYVSFVAHLRTIAKRLVQGAIANTGGRLPIDFEADIVGTSERNYLETEFHRVGEKLGQLSGVRGGPDIAFRPVYGVDENHVRWQMITGNPELTQSGADWKWDTTAPFVSVKGAKTTRSGEGMINVAYGVGTDFAAKAVDTSGLQPDQFVNEHTNPSLEVDAAGYGSGSGGTGNTFTGARIVSPGHTGAAFWRVGSNGVNTTPAYTYLGAAQNCTPGDVVTLGFWAKASAAATLVPSVRTFSAAGGGGTEAAIAPVIVGRNDVINPSPQLSSTGYNSNAGTGGTVTAARTAGAGYDGDYGFKVLWTTKPTVVGGYASAGGNAADDVAVVPGDVIYPSVWAKPTVDQVLRLDVQFFTSAGAFISHTTLVPGASYPANTWSRVGGLNAITVPPTAARAFFAVAAGTGGVLWEGSLTNLLRNPGMEAGGSSTVIRTNYVGNPHARNANWSAQTPANTPGYEPTGATDGDYAFYADITTSGANVLRMKPGIWGVAPTTLAVGSKVTVGIDFYSPIAGNFGGLELNQGGGSAYTVSPTNIPVAIGWNRLTYVFTTTFATNSFQFQIQTAGVTLTAGQRFKATRATMEFGSTNGEYFEGGSGSANDFTHAWVGTANASNSTRSAIPANDAGINGSGFGVACQSTQWSASGTKSLRIIPDNPTNNDTFCSISPVTGMTTSQLYTVVAKVRLAGTAGGTLNAKALGVRVNWNGVDLPITTLQAVGTTAGVYTYRGQFTTGASGTLSFFRLMNGSDALNGTDVWWDDVTLVAGDYAGPPFHGGLTETGHTLAWSGTANASTSTRTGDSLTIDHVSTVAGDYADGASPNAKWQGTAYASKTDIYYREAITTGWTFHTFSYTVPPGVLSLRPVAVVNPNATFNTLNLDFDDLSWADGLTPADFNGETADTDDYEYVWLGATWQSASMRYAANGYPRLEGAITDSTDDPNVLQGYLNAMVDAGRAHVEMLSFQAHKSVSPLVTDYAEGDYARIAIGENNPRHEAGEHRIRIMSITVKLDEEFATITTSPERVVT